MVDGVVLPSNAKRKFISFAQGPTGCFFCLAHHAFYSNRWNFLQYNDVADQFFVVWLGIVAVMVDVKLTYTSSGSKSLSVPYAATYQLNTKNMHFTRADLHAWPFSRTQKKGFVYYNACVKSLDYTRTRDERRSSCRGRSLKGQTEKIPGAIPCLSRTVPSTGASQGGCEWYDGVGGVP